MRAMVMESSARWISTAIVGGALLSSAMSACTTTEASRIGGESDIATIGAELRTANFDGTSLPPKTLALTFDDGPGDRTSELSAYLKAEGIRAAFFVNGAHIAQTALPNPNGLELVQNGAAILAQLAADGHLVANHTETHRDLVTQVLPSGQLLQELAETDAHIAGNVPSNRFLFRAPYGSWNGAVSTVLKATAMNKYVGPIYWDMGGQTGNYPDQAADWACWQGQLGAGAGGMANGTGYATTQQCGDAYLNDIQTVGRGIVLMHDPYSWAQGSTVDMVKYLVPKLKEAGYTFVRADEVPAIAAALPCAPPCVTCAGAPNVWASCAAGDYLKDGQCLGCTTCPAGQHQTAACTTTSDTTCAPCAEGTASASPGKLACDTCLAGTYAAAGATACSPCLAGTFAPGGTGSCTTCSPGTFAPAQSAACTPCAAGSYADAPGASACTACVDGCDDKDECTTDTCDAAKGCLHVAIAGCGEPVDGGVDAGPVEEDGGDGASDDGGQASLDAGPGDIDAADAAGPSDPLDQDASTSEADASAVTTPPSVGLGGGGCNTGRGAADGRTGALLFGLLFATGVRRRTR